MVGKEKWMVEEVTLVTSDDPHSPSLSRCKGFKFEGPQGPGRFGVEKRDPFHI